MGSRAKPPKAEPSGGKSTRSVRVLLVDDDELLLRSLTKGLAALDVSVVAASTAAEALAVIADPSVPIDVIVLDMVLPDSWGSQVAMERTLYRPRVPVVYISGYSRGDAVLAASSAGDDVHFLGKPFTPAELATMIRRAADESPTRE